jgi:hypothetical protein
MIPITDTRRSPKSGSKPLGDGVSGVAGAALEIAAAEEATVALEVDLFRRQDSPSISTIERWWTGAHVRELFEPFPFRPLGWRARRVARAPPCRSVAIACQDP